MADVQLLLRTLPALLEGLAITLAVSVATVIASLPFALVFALARGSSVALIRAPATAYVELFRNLPLLQILFLVFFGLPLVGISLPGFAAAVIALAVWEIAYFAEILRAGIESVSRRQTEAGEALGMTSGQVARLVVLPQGLVASIPPLLSQFIFVVKDSSLISTIGVVELTKTAQIVAGRTATAIPFFLAVAFIYLTVTTLLGLAAATLEKRFQKWHA